MMKGMEKFRIDKELNKGIDKGGNYILNFTCCKVIKLCLLNCFEIQIQGYQVLISPHYPLDTFGREYTMRYKLSNKYIIK